MSFLIDRRSNPKQRSAVNRQRFLRRYRERIKESVAENLRGRGITQDGKGEKISIPARDTSEPTFRHGPGGTKGAYAWGQSHGRRRSRQGAMRPD